MTPANNPRPSPLRKRAGHPESRAKDAEKWLGQGGQTVVKDAEKGIHLPEEASRVLSEEVKNGEMSFVKIPKCVIDVFRAKLGPTDGFVMPGRTKPMKISISV